MGPVDDSHQIVYSIPLTFLQIAQAGVSPLRFVEMFLCDFVTVEFVVTESSTGTRKRFREMTVAHV